MTINSFYAPVTQLVEYKTFNFGVTSSNLVGSTNFFLALFQILYNMGMNELTVEWRHIEWVATFSGKSPIDIEQLRDKFFKENDDEKTMEEGKSKDN